MYSGKTRILMVRHGQSTWNQEHRWQGQADPPLSQHGQKQAQKAAQTVGTVDAIFSSTQVRSLQTAAIIGENIGVGPIISLEGLRDRNVGEWSGLTRETIYTNWPDWEETGYRPNGWESDDSVLERSLTALNEISSEFEGGTVLAVTHSGVLITLERHFKVNQSRIPNLHGRIFEVSKSATAATDQVQLIETEISTGGHLSDDHI